MPNALIAHQAAAPDIELYRIQGEDAPLWLAGGFVALGLPMALAAGYLLASPEAPAARSALAPAHVAHLQPAPKPRAPVVLAPLRRAPPAAKASAGEAPPVLPTRREAECLPVMSIAFAHKSARPILEGAEAQFEPLLKWLKDHPDAMLLVEGHANPKGGEAYNVMLSYSRARAVIAWLAGIGIEKQRMTSLAAGTALPKNPALVVADNRMVLLQVAGVAVCQTEGVQKQ
jgi:outer membrane protein OmpA-like peptidoglycan-associated protein